jgi:hypothetical protein
VAGIAIMDRKMLVKVDTHLNSQIEIIMSESEHKLQHYMSSPSQTDPPSVFS